MLNVGIVLNRLLVRLTWLFTGLICRIVLLRWLVIARLLLCHVRLLNRAKMWPVVLLMLLVLLLDYWYARLFLGV